MCGIVGIVDDRPGMAIDRDLIELMTDSLEHRGPDDRGVYVDEGVALGHRRLAIIDLARGTQPLANEDGTVVVVYNGEIYNFSELANQLSAQGHRFRSNCDTEVVVHAWEEWGSDCVNRFRGMFSFAIWDRNKKTLFAARDRLGIKPLYYGELPNGQLLFASELKAILPHPDLPKQLDPEAVEDFFAFGYIPDPKSILKHVRKLPPGHCLMKRKGKGLEINGYWDLSFANTSTIPFRDAQAELVERLREAVRIRMISDVPLGAFLSGGVDSSVVVATMASIANGPVRTCSISFSEKEFDEAAYAKLVATRYGTNHHVETVASDDFGLINRLAEIYDEPFADSSSLPTFRLCELARKKVTVCLSGDGGDESFAGYARHRVHVSKDRIRSWIPATVRRPLFSTLGRLIPKADWAPRYFRMKTTLETLGMDSIDSFGRAAMISTAGQRERLFSNAFRDSLQGYNAIEVFRGHAASADTDHPLSLAQYLDFKIYLPADILTKVDRASMAHSLEVRVPILDHQMVEWTATLPPEYKLRGTGKYILKRAFEPFLPKEVLHRRKMGFSIPLAAWLRGPLSKRVHSAMRSTTLRDSGIFNGSYLDRIAREHHSGLRNHSELLWALIVFELFHRRMCCEESGLKDFTLSTSR